MESGEPGVAVYRRAKPEIKSSLFKLQDHIFSPFLPGTRLEDLQDSETLGVGTRATEHRAQPWPPGVPHSDPGLYFLLEQPKF